MRLSILRDEDLRRLTLGIEDDVHTAMQTMNDTGRTLVLVVSGDRLVGVVADGDIRRHLAGGGSADELITAAMNPTPTVEQVATPSSSVRAHMARRGLEYLPLLDGDRIVALGVLERATRSGDLTAVIMSGGLGTRLAPLTDDCPKPMLPLNGQPILGHIFDHLQSQGVHHFVLAVNHLSHVIIDHYNDGSERNCFIDYVQETQRLGTGGALSLIDPDTLSDPFICMNGDVLNDIDIGLLYDTHTTRQWDATMVVRPYSATIPYGVVDSADDGAFERIREKPVQTMQINAGIYLLAKSTLDLVPRGEYFDLPSLFEMLHATGRLGGTYTHHGRWIDIGTRSEYDRAEAIFSNKQAGTQ